MFSFDFGIFSLREIRGASKVRARYLPLRLLSEQKRPPNMVQLISALALLGAEAHASDDRIIGRIGQVYVDDISDVPIWVTVKTGIFGSSETFVPLTAATFEGVILRVPFSREFVKHAPRIDSDASLIVSQEDALYRYYDQGLSQGDDPVVHGQVHPGGSEQSSGDYPEVTRRPEEFISVGAGSGKADRALLRRHLVAETVGASTVDPPFDATASHRSSPLTGT